MTVPYKLSLGQLAAAISVAIQDKDSILLTKVLNHDTVFIAIGVSYFSAHLCSLNMTDMFFRFGEAVALLVIY